MAYLEISDCMFFVCVLKIIGHHESKGSSSSGSSDVIDEKQDLYLGF